MAEIKLNPVTYTLNSFKKGPSNPFQQALLLKAMQVTSDPKELRAMMGVKTVAEVYRTLDKLQMRKEYHEALSRNEISFDFIVKGLKDEATNPENKGGDRIKAYATLLKSVGMEKYEGSEASTGGGTWEEALLKNASEEASRLPEKSSVSEVKNNTGEYEVITPKIPDSIKKAEEEEAELTKGIYG